jgi:predicted flap endonuclease-1-like 5' DNA nuclease
VASTCRSIRSLVPGFVVGLGAGLAVQQWRRRKDLAELDRQRLEGEAESERLRLRLASVQERPSLTPVQPSSANGATAHADGGPAAFGAPGAVRRDDLKRIKGIGPVMERSLNELGIESWEQIARLTGPDIDRLTAAIAAFPGRIERDDWVGGARRLMEAEQANETQAR